MHRDTHRVGEFYVNSPLNAELSTKRRLFAAVTSYESTLVSMVIRSAQGSGDAEAFASRFCDDSADLVSVAGARCFHSGRNGTGAGSAGVACLFQWRRNISRTTGKNRVCCSAHFAASPFKGLFVLYSDRRSSARCG